ncbi:MAG: MobA/MobL family protein [Schwartzia sp.]|nr:MobA/MobL family protein [Schwartzia sp. (in: firmicutes)]
MSIFHCAIKIGSRGAGRSAVAASAYRSGEKLLDRETGMTHDFERKSGVVFSEVLLPKNAPEEFLDRETLWNSAQNAERQKNGQLYRDVELALPKEMTRLEQIEAVNLYAQENFVSQGMCVDWSLHDKGDGNPHAHLMLTTRGIDEKGRWEPKRKTMYEHDEFGERIPILDKDGNQKIGKNGRRMWKRKEVEMRNWNDPQNAERWRAAWATTCNRYLDGNNQIDHRSFERRGITHIIPTKHEGFAAREIERRGGVAQVCEVNREIRRINAARLGLENERNGIIVDMQKARHERALRRHHEEIQAIKKYGGDRNDSTHEQNSPNRTRDAARTKNRGGSKDLIRRANKPDFRRFAGSSRSSFGDLGRARFLPDMPFIGMAQEAPRASVLLPDNERNSLEVERGEGVRDHGVFSAATSGGRDGNRIKDIITRRKAAEKAALKEQSARIDANAGKISEIKATRASSQTLKAGMKALETGADLAVGAVQKMLPNDQAKLVGAATQMIKSAMNPENILPHKAIGNALKIVMQAAEAGNKAAQAFLHNPGSLPDNIKAKWEWLSESKKAELLYEMSLRDDYMDDIGTESFMKGYKPQVAPPAIDREPRARAIWNE